MGQIDRANETQNDISSRITALNDVVRKIGEVLLDYSSPTSSGSSAPVNQAYPTETKPDTALAIFAHKIYLSRRDRENTKSLSGIFGEPAWDILLDLFIAHARNKFISITDSGIAGQVPVTTALRWLWILEKAGLIERQPDKTDKRRSFVMLSANGLAYMRKTLETIGNRMVQPLFSK